MRSEYLPVGNYCDNPLTIADVEYSIRLNERKLNFYEKKSKSGLQPYVDAIDRLQKKLQKLKDAKN